MITSLRTLTISFATAVLIAAALIFAVTQYANAFGVANFSNTVTSQEAGEVSDHTIVFTLNASTTVIENETITIQFASGTDAARSFDTSAITVADIDLGVPADQTLGAAANATDWGVAIDSNSDTITFTAPSTAATYVAAGGTVTINIGTVATGGANQVINPTTSSEDAVTAGSLGSTEGDRYHLSLGGTFGDEGAVALPILEDDDVNISATVDPTLTFELHSTDDDATLKFFDAFGNAVNFGDLSSTQAKWATIGATSTGATSAGSAHGFRVGTNAAAGYSVTVNGATLTNGNSDTITAVGGTAAASAVGTEQFGMCISDDTTGVSGTTATDAAQQGVIAAQYDCGAGYAFTAGSQAVASGNAAGPTSMTFYDVNYLANITALTESGVYSTALTYIATGTF